MADTTSATTLNLEGAQSILSAALGKAEEMGLAANKAYTVTGFGGMASDQWWDAIKDEPALLHGMTHTPRLVIFGGGVGVFVGDQLVGAVGVSGGSAEQDAEVAQAGADAIA